MIRGRRSSGTEEAELTFDGSVSEGDATASASKLEYTRDLEGEKPRKLRQTVEWKGKDAYDWHVEMEDGSGWKTMIRSTFQRTAPPSRPAF